jgi:hypothetical protein
MGFHGCKHRKYVQVQGAQLDEHPCWPLDGQMYPPERDGGQGGAPGGWMSRKHDAADLDRESPLIALGEPRMAIALDAVNLCVHPW